MTGTRFLSYSLFKNLVVYGKVRIFALVLKTS